jgi:hypothetical protein
MIRRRAVLASVLPILLAVLGAVPSTASAEVTEPAWTLRLTSQPTNFVSGSDHLEGGRFPQYLLIATNVGGAPTSGPVTITEELPAGISPAAGSAPVAIDKRRGIGKPLSCTVASQTVNCIDNGAVSPGEWVMLELPVDVGSFPDPSTVVDEASISGGGGPAVSASVTSTVSAGFPTFDFLPGKEGVNASITAADGAPVTQAGSHPYQATLGFGFATKTSSALPVAAGTVRELKVDLPAGLVVNPGATPRCTEAQLEETGPGTLGGCPNGSAVGVIGVPLILAGVGPDTVSLYNMVPPPGVAAEFGFVVANVALHIKGGVRPDDFRLTSDTPDILAKVPLFNAQVQLWGSPSDPSHDAVRGHCGEAEGSTATCPVQHGTAPFLTMPTSCTETATLESEADSWEEPSLFRRRSVPFGDLSGNPVGVSGCNTLQFSPTLQVRPTTNLIDSPSGLSVELHVPQPIGLNNLAEAQLEKAIVTLPEGLVINPSSANGLEACSSSQVGISPETGVADASHPSCPAASRIGTVEVDTPLLEEQLPGSVYAATPHENPFDSLLAIYVVIDDPATGVLLKLAGHVEADPGTGRLTTTFDNAPQLPFEDFRLNFFGGATAVLRTPSTCASKTTTSEMTPWSAPEGVDAFPTSSFALTSAPNGPCPSVESGAANHPSFEAGTGSPQAGSYSSFVLKLAREDGSQPISRIETTLPPGLTGRLAGLNDCPDEALAAAATKAGAAERSAPSCPAGSEVGTVEVGVGAGPTPYYATGRAYLAGPYKGAPLSLAVIVPASAGPYDLGTVVTRAALYVDPGSARIRAVSDTVPQILQGIPLDLRSIVLRLNRPNFTLNPTSCEEMQITGNVTSVFNQTAPLSERFQVGGCSSLEFKPHLAIKLKGGTRRTKNPALRATLTMPVAGANIARASVALPHTEFLDQAHIRTICTRVQFAAGAGNGSDCPPGSVYGKARAFTPLLDSPLEGPVYLRSSSHPLPDLVAALHGQIEVELVGKIDSHKGGIRTTFEGVPDAPVSKFVLDMQGGKKGLLENSTNLCGATNLATALFDGHNGKTHDFKPVVKNSCKGKTRKQRRQRR